MLQKEGRKAPVYSISWQKKQPNMQEVVVISGKNQAAADHKTLEPVGINI